LGGWENELGRARRPKGETPFKAQKPKQSSRTPSKGSLARTGTKKPRSKREGETLKGGEKREKREKKGSSRGEKTTWERGKKNSGISQKSSI